ncbi:MAG: di-heme oxidoredictase family protein [Blastocatellia bacterium]
MRDSTPSNSRFGLSRSARSKLQLIAFLLVFAVLGYKHAATQNQALNITINQNDLLNGKYPQKYVIEAGGQFWTTPFTQYDAATQTGDGYGEGPMGPRAGQRKAFNPNTANYPYLRLNGLDSQSCYECHNSIGSDPGYGPNSPLIRKQPSTVGGSAGSNSNAFINPCFPRPLTLLIRQPPHVFGSGYVQTVGDEITAALYNLRRQVRQKAKSNPGVQQSINLNDPAHGVSYGTFKTTYIAGSKWKTINNLNVCGPTCPTPTADLKSAATVPSMAAADKCDDTGGVMADGFTDDVGQVQGVAYDLIVRPFQWKGVASSLRHFIRDALDFHFSMQAVEKVGSLDCDKDGKINEVSVGQVSAIAAFVGMTRPPQQMIPAGVTPESVQRGFEIFTGIATGAKLYQKMCANCHIPMMPIIGKREFVVDSPVVNQNPGCPVEATGFTSLITPLKSYSDVPVLKRIRASLNLTTAAGGNCPQPDPTYNIPLDSTDVPISSLPRLTQSTPFFLPFLRPPANAFYVPFFSDLKTHNMGKFLADIAQQGADVSGVCLQMPNFLTRPLWGVADTGPWLHDGRATSLMQAILLHGDTKSQSGSEARQVVDAFELLTPADQQAVVNFLLSLRLPPEQDQSSASAR